MKKSIKISIIVIIIGIFFVGKVNALFMEPYIYETVTVKLKGMSDAGYTIEYEDDDGIHSKKGNNKKEHEIILSFSSGARNREEQPIKFIIKYDNGTIKETYFKLKELNYEKESMSYILDLNCNLLRIVYMEPMITLIIIVSSLFFVSIVSYIVLIIIIKKNNKS